MSSTSTRLPSGFAFAAAILMNLAGAWADNPASVGKKANDATRRITVFYTSGVQGTLEPCGCTSDPLGGIDRYAALVSQTRKREPVVLLDGGDLSFSTAGISPKKMRAAELRADFLAKQLTRLGLAGSALGGADLLRGSDRVTPPRLASNLPTAAFALPGRVVTAGTVKLGIFGVADPAAMRERGLRAEDPGAAAEREAMRLRALGAEVIIVVAAIDRPAARKLARRAAVDFVVLGAGAADGLEVADREGNAFIVAAAAELQKAGRLDLVLGAAGDGPGGPFVDAGGPEALAARKRALDQKLIGLEKQIGQWQADRGGSVDQDFLAGKVRERDGLRGERAQLAEQVWQPPTKGRYFINRLIPMSRALNRDGAIATAMKGLDRAVAKVNLATAEAPPKGEPGRAIYVGDRRCAGCHKEDMAWWKTTVHARGWKTLVTGGKQHDLECVGCHVTGYGEVGGSAVGFTRGLEAIQCETCHGPGSLHVAQEGLDEPSTMRLEAPETLCLQCHNEKHSDTFNYQAYLRDVLGPGHGKQKRDQLGPGPTGHQLRQAAMLRAKQAGAALKKNL